MPSATCIARISSALLVGIGLAAVQGRVLYIEGCALQNSSVAAVEALARSLPHVQQAIAIVRTDPTAPPPYKLRPP